jgi:hypothetical protein
VPARIDLDTVLSKIDSRIIQDMLIISGPYSVRHGPGFDFVDVLFLPTPRYECGPEFHGLTSLDYKTSGRQWYGRQAVWGGSDNWGCRVGYGHRTGRDYRTGAGTEIPASYNSREIDLALGVDLQEDRRLEFVALRLDQTDVEYPGMAFDMDFLFTDGYEMQFVDEGSSWWDRATVEGWYNRTRFAGNAQSPAKREQFPYLDFLQYEGFTDVESMSTGCRVEATWGEEEEPQTTVGVDLRFLKQELNEIASGRGFQDANSPIPRSQWADPGIYVEHSEPVFENLLLNGGFRVGFTQARVVDDPAKLEELGLAVPQSSLADILGTDQFDQSFTPWALFATGHCEACQYVELSAGVGYAQRPPSLTELYAAQSFMFVLQNGQNTLTGDPLLFPEQILQIDLGLTYRLDRFHAAINGFHAWMFEYITFENLRVFRIGGQAEQVSLKYVNTDLATLTGVEMLLEYEATDKLTAFATLKYVEGRDHTRNGHFATRRATPGIPSQRVPGLPRGAFSGVVGPAVEPLPSILPLESRVGVRLHEAIEQPRWNVEFSLRLVDDQHRVAASLMETPTPGFVTSDLRGFCQATDKLLLLAGVENIGDRAYREHLDFRAPNGRQVLRSGVNFYFGTELTY